MSSVTPVTPGIIASVAAAANLTRFRFIGIAGNHCAADEAALGVSQIDVDSGQMAAVMITGVALVEAGGAISAGDHVKSDASGRAVVASPISGATSAAANGRALQTAGAAGEFIRVKLI